MRANSSFPIESKELQFYSLEKSNIEILLILSPPSLFLNPIEKGVIHLIGKIFENLLSIRRKRLQRSKGNFLRVIDIILIVLLAYGYVHMSKVKLCALNMGSLFYVSYISKLSIKMDH